ncbi:hypothetical protein B0H14DRAFT_3048288, partial [Mycena olivaceomarginata]
ERFAGTQLAIRALKQCSLAYTLNGFLRVLSPVRQYTQSHPELSTTLATTLFTRMAELYFNLIPTEEPSSASSIVCEHIRFEIGNISTVLDLCLTHYADVQCALQNILNFSRVCRYLNIYDTRLLSKAAALYTSLNRLDDAEQALQSALNLHIEVNDRLGRANDLRRLGQLYMALDRVEDAEQVLQSALHLHTEVNYQLGQANDLQGLGWLYTRLDRLKDAEQVLQSALNLHTAVNARLSQAHDLQGLGELYTRLDRLEDAEQALHSALDLYIRLDSSLGQGDSLGRLGNLCTTQCKFAEAEDFLARAMKVYGHAQNPRGQEWTEGLFEILHKKQKEQAHMA